MADENRQSSAPWLHRLDQSLPDPMDPPSHPSWGRPHHLGDLVVAEPLHLPKQPAAALPGGELAKGLVQSGRALADLAGLGRGLVDAGTFTWSRANDGR